jgi:Protein of unknown function (DUF3306)
MAEDFLRRWSRLKHAQAAQKPAEKQPLEKKAAEAPPALPPVDKLTPDSDFTGFMQPKVEDSLRRAALKKLFNDPHFNIPDPFEAYSGDFTVGEPIPPEMLATLNQAKTLLFDKTEEDVAKEKAEEKIADKVEETKPDEPRRQDA